MLRLLLCVILTSVGVAQTGRASSSSGDDARQWVETISWQPRAQVYHNFITPEECDDLINKARPQLRQSTVVGEGGKSVLDTVRTSRGTFLLRNSTPLLEALEKRLELWSHYNVSHQEDIQILRYSNMQKYGAHMDVIEEGSPRVATVLMYLTDVEEGGETAFPSDSKWADPTMERKFGPFSDCARGSVAVRPKKGMALIFYSMKPDMKTLDPHSMHTGCPVIKGVKWTATAWIHSIPFRMNSFREHAPDVKERIRFQPEDCGNLHSDCDKWAGEGECEKNRNFMVGTADGFGECRKACRVCEDCSATDTECRARNRLTAGFPALSELT